MEHKAVLLLIGGEKSDLPHLRESFRQNYELMEADGLASGLEQLQHGKKKVSAVLFDLCGQELPGPGLLPRNIPVIGLLPPADWQAAEDLLLQMGADVIHRPYTDRLLSHRLEQALQLFHSRETQSQLENSHRREKLLIQQSDNIILEWDLRNDHMKVSDNWKDRFGYAPTAGNLKAGRRKIGHIHPDDLHVLHDLIDRVRKGFVGEEIELRIADKDGQYLWHRLRASAIVDEQGKPVRAVGTLTDIDSTKRSYLALQEQAKKDPLTGLLNKTATQDAIRLYLEHHPNVDCALMMIDLDNFKGINDRYGHLFGDTVLVRSAQTIRRMFREDDVVGRVGGDEFMVLMKDVRSRKLLTDRCQKLIEHLTGLFDGEIAGQTVSCSVGMALFPEHSSSFRELFQRADQALYHSKQQGKHCCTIYRPDLEVGVSQLTTPIDSNEQPGLANGSLISTAFQLLASCHDIEKAIEQVLAMMGQRTNVSRVYIFENNEDNTHCSNTFEWCNHGIRPEKKNLQNICYDTALPHWEENYDESGILFCTDIAHLKPEPRAILEPQGIKSLLHWAIREDGVFRGFIGLDECITHRVWTKEQITTLISISQVVASFLLAKRKSDRQEAEIARLQALVNEK